MRTVLDASALMAFLLDEPGKSVVMAAILDEPAMTTVNFCEVASRYALRGASNPTVRGLRHRLPIELVPVDADLALEAALLAPATKPAGLSLGDRICLALAQRLRWPALTADRSWTAIANTIGVEVQLIR